MKKKPTVGSLVLGLVISMLFFAIPVSATHIIGGELTFHADTTNTSPLRYFFKLVIYQDATGSAADNPQATLYFSDGTTSTTHRTSKTLLPANPNIYRSVYYLAHQFPALGNFIVSFKETNRAIGFLNMINSESQPIFIQASVTIGLQAAGNHSPVFLAPFISTGVLGQPYRHNVTAYDPNGDSLAYKLVPSLQNINQPIVSYQFPESITMNNRTGEIIWTKTDKVGRFALAVEIREYRQGQLIGKVMRDFEVLILPVGSNMLVQIQNRDQLSVNSRNQLFITDTGTPVKIRVAATNAGTLEAYSELSKLGIISAQVIADNPLEKEFTLTPNATLRRSLPYIITFRGTATTASTQGRYIQQDVTLAVYFRPDRATDEQNTNEPGEQINPTGNPEPVGEGLAFNIYPNPVKDWVKISKNNIKPETLLVYNATSQLVLSQKLTLRQTVLQRNSQISPGIYFYVVLSEAGKIKHTGKLLFL